MFNSSPELYADIPSQDTDSTHYHHHKDIFDQQDSTSRHLSTIDPSDYPSRRAISDEYLGSTLLPGGHSSFAEQIVPSVFHHIRQTKHNRIHDRFLSVLQSSSHRPDLSSKLLPLSSRSSQIFPSSTSSRDETTSNLSIFHSDDASSYSQYQPPQALSLLSHSFPSPSSLQSAFHREGRASPVFASVPEPLPDRERYVGPTANPSPPDGSWVMGMISDAGSGISTETDAGGEETILSPRFTEEGGEGTNTFTHFAYSTLVLSNDVNPVPMSIANVSDTVAGMAAAAISNVTAVLGGEGEVLGRERGGNISDVLGVGMGGGGGEGERWVSVLVLVLKAVLMGAVILLSVLGNLLVIVSVIRYHRLRVITNYFVVSMALADMLVALMAMAFNASVQLTDTWLFGPVMCDLWNSMDVYFSTVSILHLCCISIDRYTAIVQPLDYSLRMTRSTVALMIAVAWISPLTISALPIFLGWYTTQEQLDLMATTPGLCDFKVNQVYAVVSSSVSFWIPGIIMLVMYFRIYREADRQEMMVFRSTVAALLLNKHLHINGITKGNVKITDTATQQKTKSNVAPPSNAVQNAEATRDIKIITTTDGSTQWNIIQGTTRELKDLSLRKTLLFRHKYDSFPKPKCSLRTTSSNASYSLAQYPVQTPGIVLSNSVPNLTLNRSPNKCTKIGFLRAMNVFSQDQKRLPDRILPLDDTLDNRMRNSQNLDVENQLYQEDISCAQPELPKSETIAPTETAGYKSLPAGEETIERPAVPNDSPIALNISKANTNTELANTTPASKPPSEMNRTLKATSKFAKFTKCPRSPTILRVRRATKTSKPVKDETKTKKKRFLGVGVSRTSKEEVTPDRQPDHKSPSAVPEGEDKKKQASLHKMKRERKAAKTLGIIVSVFLLCWMPFFTWYLLAALCGDPCEVPEPVVTTLFWIGYFNSTLNPIIYAYFNRDFRKAFRKTLKHYWGVFGFRRVSKVLQKLIRCPTCCTCCTCCAQCCAWCAPCCPCCCAKKTMAEAFSSDAGLRSAISSEYIHIEMTAVDHKI